MTSMPFSKRKIGPWVNAYQKSKEACTFTSANAFAAWTPNDSIDHVGNHPLRGLGNEVCNGKDSISCAFLLRAFKGLHGAREQIPHMCRLPGPASLQGPASSTWKFLFTFVNYKGLFVTHPRCALNAYSKVGCGTRTAVDLESSKDNVWCLELFVPSPPTL